MNRNELSKYISEIRCAWEKTLADDYAEPQHQPMNVIMLSAILTELVNIRVLLEMIADVKLGGVHDD